MLAETVARVSPPVPRDRVLVVTGQVHGRAVRAALPGLARTALLLEPAGRNTAAAVARAAVHVAREHPEAVMAVLPADHAIGDIRAFRADLSLALDVAERTGTLVTLGVRPRYPETGYGYIRPGAAMRGTGGRVAWVEAFIEKPSRARAEALVADRRVLWNAGIFAWRADTILDALGRHAPAVLGPLAAAAPRASARAWADAYRRLPSASIDTAVLERTERVAVVRARFPWSDIGSWAALEPLWRTPANGRNAVRGRALPIDSRGCVVDSPHRLVALVGVDDLVVVDAPDAVLVCRKDRAQDVRLVVDELRRRRLLQYL
jgi:mannose-1-phosphate guanylyltransferase